MENKLDGALPHEKVVPDANASLSDLELLSIFLEEGEEDLLELDKVLNDAFPKLKSEKHD